MINPSFDAYVSPFIRERIEQRYYARINAAAQFECLIRDAAFWQDTASHPALFSDHGVVHVRDVAQQIQQVLSTINGVLIPHRAPDRLAGFMIGYGVILAYLHDIGMTDLSPYGRAIHPEYAAHAVFTGELDDVLDDLWTQDCGHVAQRLSSLAEAGVLKRDPRLVFRELLALSVGHSKSKIPIGILNDPAALRSQLHFVLSHSLPDLYRRQQTAKGFPIDPSCPTALPAPPLDHYYADFTCAAFDWLSAESDAGRALAADAIDTLRALRCADALRQRGTVQKTSGGYEVYISRETGRAVFALRRGDDKLYLMEMLDKPESAGEANIASSEFTTDGNLRLSFQRGAYANEEALQRASYYTAFVVDDFLGDIVESFRREARQQATSLKSSAEIEVLLESTDDNPRFTELVQAHLRRFKPALSQQLQIVPSLRHAAELERARYLQAAKLDWDLVQRQVTLERVKQSGQKVADFDLVEGFKHVKLIHVQAGATLIEAGTPAAFVYVPLENGLKIMPLGGYAPFSVSAWMPIGNTGVIRGAIRNADVIAEQDLALLMIPQEVYLRQWYAPYSPEELHALFASEADRP